MSIAVRQWQTRTMRTKTSERVPGSSVSAPPVVKERSDRPHTVTYLVLAARWLAWLTALAFELYDHVPGISLDIAILLVTLTLSPAATVRAFLDAAARIELTVRKVLCVSSSLLCSSRAVARGSPGPGPRG